MNASVSSIALLSIINFSTPAFAQTVINDGDNVTVTSQADGETISVASGVTSTVNEAPVVVFNTSDVTLDNAGTLSTLGAGTNTVQVNPNASGGTINNSSIINGDSRAVDIQGDMTTLNNTGQILGTATQRNGTVYADAAAQNTVINNQMGGVIDAGMGNEGSGVGHEIDSAGNTFSLTNAGTIQGRGNAGAALNTAGDGVRIGNVGNMGTATVTASNTGTIASEGANGTVGGVRVVNGVALAGTFDNSGTIAGVQNGVYFGEAAHSGTFTNEAGGVISSDSRAFNLDGTGLTVNNAGDILGTGNQRNGTFYADGTADDFTVNNLAAGVIDAGTGNEGSGFGAEIGSAADGANTFTLDNAGTITGRGNAAASTNAAGDGVRIGNPGNMGVTDATIINSGTITSEGQNGTVAGLRVVDGVGFQGTLTNEMGGEISGPQNGVYFGNGDHTGGVVNNAGLISSDSRAFNLDGTGLTVNNSGDILGTASQRNGTFYADGTADDFEVNNQAGGVIDAGIGNEGSGFGAEIGSAADGANTFTLTNAGTIQGRGNASAATNAAGDGVRIGNVGNVGIVELTATNSGLIASEGANGTVAGVRFVNGISFAGTFDNSGTITGVQNGVYFGNPVDGMGADHSNGVFNNLAGGIISSDSRAFNIDGLGLTVNNAGDILGTDNQRNGTVYADGTADNFTFNNEATGVIDAGMGNEGSGFGAEIGGAVNGANTLTLNNAGTIQGRGNADAGTNAAGDGVRIGNVGNIGVAEATIINTGTIASEGANGTVAGIRFVNGISFSGTLDNSGTISGVQNGVYFGNPVDGEGADHSMGVFNNLEGGLISSDSRAFNIDGLGLTVNNAGSILGTGNQRNGTVYADGTADDFTFNNEATGIIDAGEGNTGSGFGAEIGGAVDGANTFVLTNAGTIQGRGNADAGTNAAGDGVRIGNVGNTGIAEATITNSGLIASEGANGTVAGVRFVNGISFSGTFDNSGTITGVQNGVYFGNPVDGEGADHSMGVFNNLAGGLISSDSRAFNIDGLGLTVNNAGSILGTGNQRNGTVYADGTADNFTFNNQLGGIIDAGEGNTGSGFGAEIGGATDGANTFVVTNAGTIQGRGDAAAGTNAAGDGVRIGNVGNTGLAEGTITNSGLIASEGANGTVAGIRIVNGVSFAGTIENSGTITGVQNGLYFGNAISLDEEDDDFVGGIFTDAVVNNLEGGVISSGSRAFNLDGLGLTVNNAGSILGLGDQRNGTFYADATADQYTLNNLATGVIDAGVGNNGSGVSLQSGNVDGETVTFTVDNAGLIAGRGEALPTGAAAGLRVFQGADGVIVDATINNSGTITSETSAAILIEGVNFTGTVTNSGELTGVAAFDASNALGSVEFINDGGSLNGDFVGSSFSDTLTFQGASTLAGSVIGDVATEFGGTTTVSGAQSIEGDVTANGTLDFVLGQDSLAVDGNATFGAGSVVNVGTADDVTTTVLNAPTSVVSETGTFTDNGVTVNVLDDDFLVNYSVALASVSVTATAADLSVVSADANVSSFGTAITSAFAAGTLQADVANALNDVADAAGFEAASLSLLPAINEGVTREVYESHELADRYVSRRLASDAQTGAWIQAFGRTADRDAESTSVSGYDADSFGVAVGADTKVGEKLTIGAAFNYANVSIDSEGPGLEETDIDTFQVSAYAGYNAGPAFVNGQIGYIFGNGDSERTGVTGSITGDADLDGFTFRVDGGYDFEAGTVTITPQAGLRYASLSQDDFTETGGLGLSVDTSSVDFLDLRFGTEARGNFESFRPFVRAAYVIDVIGDGREFNVAVPGATTGPVFLTTTDAPQSRFEIGTGFSWDAGNGLSVGVEYDGEFASDYSAHAGFVRARLVF
ncbi:MAG: autotransporter domain-containing protein [Pseudomonadota bacterium]